MHNVSKDIEREQREARNQMKTGGKDGKPSDLNIDQDGLLGKVPDDVESIAELMLQDSDINVYQQSKVVLKEEAFYIRGKK